MASLALSEFEPFICYLLCVQLFILLFFFLNPILNFTPNNSQAVYLIWFYCFVIQMDGPNEKKRKKRKKSLNSRKGQEKLRKQNYLSHKALQTPDQPVEALQETPILGTPQLTPDHTNEAPQGTLDYTHEAPVSSLLAQPASVSRKKRRKSLSHRKGQEKLRKLNYSTHKAPQQTPDDLPEAPLVTPGHALETPHLTPDHPPEAPFVISGHTLETPHHPPEAPLVIPGHVLDTPRLTPLVIGHTLEAPNPTPGHPPEAPLVILGHDLNIPHLTPDHPLEAPLVVPGHVLETSQQTQDHPPETPLVIPGHTPETSQHTQDHPPETPLVIPGHTPETSQQTQDHPPETPLVIPGHTPETSQQTQDHSPETPLVIPGHTPETSQQTQDHPPETPLVIPGHTPETSQQTQDHPPETPLVIPGHTPETSHLTSDHPPETLQVILDNTLETPHLTSGHPPEAPQVTQDQPADPSPEAPQSGNFANIKIDLENCDLGDFKMILDKGDRLIIASFYDGTVPTVKMAITVSLDGNVSLHVHNREVTRSHDIWNYLPRNCSVSQYVQCLIQRIQHYSVCVGNPDEDMINLTPVGCGLSLPDSVGLGAYREGDFHATCGNLSYSSTIRHTECDLLVEGVRCSKCRRVRDGLRARRTRQRQRSNGEMKKSTPNIFLSPEEKDIKLTRLNRHQKSLKRRILVLEDKVARLEEKVKKDIEQQGESLSNDNCDDLLNIMKDSRSYIMKTFGPDSFQRIFFEQQVKYNELRSKKSMRWHPSIIRWCLYLRSKSSKAYDGISVAVRYKKSISIIETVISIDYRYIDFLASYFSDRSRGIDRVGDNWRTVNASTNPHISDQLRTEYAC